MKGSFAPPSTVDGVSSLASAGVIPVAVVVVRSGGSGSRLQFIVGSAVSSRCVRHLI